METKKMEQIYQLISNALVNMVPEGWKKIL